MTHLRPTISDGGRWRIEVRETFTFRYVIKGIYVIIGTPKIYILNILMTLFLFLALPLFENPAKGHTHSYMLSRTNGDDGFATFGYWANKFSDTEKIPFAFCFVKKIKQHN